MDNNKLAADLNLNEADRGMLRSFEFQLHTMKETDIEGTINEILHSDEFLQPENLNHQYAKAALVLAVNKREGNTGEKVSTLPSGVRTLSDLVNPDKAHKTLEDIDDRIDFFKKELNRTDDSPEITQLNEMREDTLKDLRQIGELRNKHTEVMSNIEAEQQTQMEERETEEKKAFFDRRHAENERLNISGEEAEQHINDEWNRFKQGY